MNELRKYDISIFGLEEKAYEYEFESGDAFFEAMEQDLIQHGAFRTRLRLEKTATMIRLDFHIVGEIELLCDRTLEPFREPLDLQERMFLKFADHSEELTEEIELIAWNTQVVNVARFIFEFIGLAVPVRKLHPRLRDDDEDDSEEEGRLIYSSGGDAPDDDDRPEPPIDPRWEALRKLSDN